VGLPARRGRQRSSTGPEAEKKKELGDQGKEEEGVTKVGETNQQQGENVRLTIVKGGSKTQHRQGGRKQTRTGSAL